MDALLIPAEAREMGRDTEQSRLGNRWVVTHEQKNCVIEGFDDLCEESMLTLPKRIVSTGVVLETDGRKLVKWR